MQNTKKLLISTVLIPVSECNISLSGEFIIVFKISRVLCWLIIFPSCHKNYSLSLFFNDIIKSLPLKDYDTEDSYKIWEDLFAEFGNMVRLRVPGAPPIVGTTNPDHVETFMKSTLQNPIREGFRSLKAVRDAAPNNYFNKKAGLLPE